MTVKMKALVAAAISLVLTSIVLGNAYYHKKQFYPSVVYVTNSNPSMAVSVIRNFLNEIFISKAAKNVLKAHSMFTVAMLAFFLF